MSEHRTDVRIDGGKAPSTLIERLNSEEFVGARLQPTTRRDYVRKVETLMNQIRVARNTDGAPTPLDVARHLAGLVATGEISQATARASKAAVLYWLAENGEAVLGTGENLEQYERAYEMVRSLQTNTLPRRTRKTSGQRLKALPEDFLVILQRYGETARGVKHIGTLLAFLRANLLVGLRPEEWFETNPFTYLSHAGERVLALRIRNSKTTQGRGNGAYRDILLHSISAKDLATLLHLLEIIDRYRVQRPELSGQELAARFFSSLRHCMNNALTQSGYPASGVAKRPSLYSTRHQAVANAKASGMTDREIAAMFGHASTSTAKSHYGKKLSAARKTTFRPSPESISQVSAPRLTPQTAEPGEQTLQAAAQWLSAKEQA